MGKALVKLVKKVKKMEDVLKRRHVLLPGLEDEDVEISSKQGRNLQDKGLDEMVRNMMKDKSEVFKTPAQGKTSGEEDIILNLEAAKTCQDISTSFEDISIGFEDISTGFEEVNTGGLGVSTVVTSLCSSLGGQREGIKDPMIVEEPQVPKRTKEQFNKKK
ncbi:hypothetical protein Tco_0804019 [Tanacetum coccineum]|uniref:Uncharacterized protein n=1 Tax=Tanacetum coccineum TaxID=301880 RepID=A0ABQ5A5Y5_9ASTR